MTFLITVTKGYKDTIQGDGRQFPIDSKLRFYMTGIDAHQLSFVINELQIKGYEIESVQSDKAIL